MARKTCPRSKQQEKQHWQYEIFQDGSELNLHKNCKSISIEG
jgi:hypothetical protein